jgi:hypothetical protein
MGALILVICFLGPILPPIIGTVVGSIYDAMKRRSESVEAQAVPVAPHALVSRAA